MTIVSHSHRFIYVKARKVASSSVLLALGLHCSGDDIVVAPGRSEGLRDPSRNNSGLRAHTHPTKIQQLISPQQWEDYTKITCVRNPWDMAVSMLLHRFSIEKKLAIYYRVQRKEFIGYSDRFRRAIADRSIDPSDPEYRWHMLACIDDLDRNIRSYFAPDGTPYADVHVRYETLQDDFNAACTDLGLPQQDLPRLKSHSRAPRWNYQDFYDNDLRAALARKASPITEYFGYEFD